MTTLEKAKQLIKDYGFPGAYTWSKSDSEDACRRLSEFADQITADDKAEIARLRSALGIVDNYISTHGPIGNCDCDMCNIYRVVTDALKQT